MKKYSAVEKLLATEIDPAFARRARLILSAIATVHPKTILDLGCGRGFYSRSCATLLPQSRVTGVDLNPQYLKTAKRTTAFSNLIFRQADATRLPFKENSFAAVVASEILEHIPDDIAALREIHRVTKPKGKILISVPYRHYPFFWDPLNWICEKITGEHLPSRIWWLSGIWADHVRLYSKEELREKIMAAGFKINHVWECTAICLPFSHFFFYGIGKNLVEKGWLKNFNRFNVSRKPSCFLKQVLKIIRFFDILNENNEKNPHRFVNLVVEAQKQ